LNLRYATVLLDLETFIHENSQHMVLEHFNLGRLRWQLISKAREVNRGDPHTSRFLCEVGSDVLAVADRMLNKVHATPDYQSLVDLFIWAPNHDAVDIGSRDEEETQEDDAEAMPTKKRKRSTE